MELNARKTEREIAEEDSSSPRKRLGSRPLGGFENCRKYYAESFRKGKRKWIIGDCRAR
jgi:hypothetical protein